jgi:hypothetical protein
MNTKSVRVRHYQAVSINTPRFSNDINKHEVYVCEIPYRTENHVRSQTFSSEILKEEEYPQFNTKAGTKYPTSTDSKDTEIEEDRGGQRGAPHD